MVRDSLGLRLIMLMYTNRKYVFSQNVQKYDMYCYWFSLFFRTSSYTFAFLTEKLSAFHKNYGVTDILENRIDIKSYKCVNEDGYILPTYNCVPARRR